MKKIMLTALFSVVLLVTCGKKEEAKQASQKISAFENLNSSVELDGSPVTIAGVILTPPATWTDNGPSGMRQADYSLDPVEGEIESATMAVFYFGPDQGGAVQANIDRWISQIKPIKGSSPIQSEITVDGMKVTTVETIGMYNSSMNGPIEVQNNSTSDHRLIGAVVQGPEGSIFCKLTGPDKTATKMTDGFVAMIRAVKKAEVTKK